jgi:hypothetical protein
MVTEENTLSFPTTSNRNSRTRCLAPKLNSFVKDVADRKKQWSGMSQSKKCRHPNNFACGIERNNAGEIRNTLTVLTTAL